jgi:hypothetical protein
VVDLVKWATPGWLMRVFVLMTLVPLELVRMISPLYVLVRGGESPSDQTQGPAVGDAKEFQMEGSIAERLAACQRSDPRERQYKTPPLPQRISHLNAKPVAAKGPATLRGSVGAVPLVILRA